MRLVNIMFSNNQCFYQTHKTGEQRNILLKQHEICALHEDASKHKGSGLDFVWTRYMQCIMNLLYKDQIPTPKLVLEYIIIETKAQISARPKCPVSKFLEGLLKNANMETD